MPEREITIEIKKPEIMILLLILSAVFILELQVTFNSPIAFGDEGFHTRMGQWIGEKREYPVWVPFQKSDVSMNGFGRPPLWNILEGGFYLLLGFHELIVKFLTPFIASILTGLGVYVLVKMLYNNIPAFASAVMAVTVPSFVTYAVLFYVDILFTFYFTLFVLTFILANKKENKKYWVLAGIFGGFSILTKSPGYAVGLMVMLGFLYELYKKVAVGGFDTGAVGGILKKYFIILIPIFIIVGSFFARSFVYYHTPDCVLPLFDKSGCNINGEWEPKYKFSGRTEEAGTEISPLKMGIINYLVFTYGNIWFVPFTFLAGLCLLFVKKNDTNVFVLLGLLSLVIMTYQTEIIFTRAEDTARFTLGWIPIIALVGGVYFEKLYDFIKGYQRHLALIIFIVIIALGYQNVVDKLGIMAQVKQFSPLFFNACDWITENTPKNASIATIWSYRAVYSCQRNAGGIGADISMSRDLNYTLSVAKHSGITHLFIQKFSIDPRNSHLEEKYDLDLIQFLDSNPEHFKIIFENGPPLQQCLQQGGCDGNVVYEIKY